MYKVERVVEAYISWKLERTSEKWDEYTYMMNKLNDNELYVLGQALQRVNNTID